MRQSDNQTVKTMEAYRASPSHCLLVSLSFLLLALSAIGAETVSPVPSRVIETHIHVSVEKPAEKGGAATDPAYTSELYQKDVSAKKVDGAVIVATGRGEAYSTRLKRLVEGSQMFLGIVGSFELGSEDFAPNMAFFEGHARFLGIRSRVDLNKPRVRDDLRTLMERGLCLDMLPTGSAASLVQVAEVAKAYPGLRIVLNHVAGARFETEVPDPAWTEALRALAGCPNVSCKVSGLFGPKKPMPSSPAYFEHVLDLVYATFGAERLMYGSNWPVVLKGGPHDAQFDILLHYFQKKGAPVLEQVFWKNAVKAYRLKLP